jgi:hypothetical protein
MVCKGHDVFVLSSLFVFVEEEVTLGSPVDLRKQIGHMDW